MEAIEFVAKIKNGIIEVPKEHLASLHNECRVIILVEDKALEKKHIKKKKRLSSLTVKTKGLVFERDEANER